ncbi:MAG TPA: phage tail protein [Acidimicrobiia bacterium]|nr:phage tail protein [Acidimicrobiia bacterium]
MDPRSASNDIRVTGSFIFEVDGKEIGVFKEVHGLRVEMEVEILDEGGQNQFAHKLPGRLTWPNIVMKRGVTVSDNLLAWLLRSAGDGFEGAGRKVEKTTAAITLVDETCNRVQGWSFTGAFPVRWEGPSLQAGSNEAAMEELEIAHHGFRSA